MKSVKLKVGDKIRYDDSSEFGDRADCFDAVVKSHKGPIIAVTITKRYRSTYCWPVDEWTFRQKHAAQFVTVLAHASQPGQA